MAFYEPILEVNCVDSAMWFSVEVVLDVDLRRSVRLSLRVEMARWQRFDGTRVVAGRQVPYRVQSGARSSRFRELHIKGRRCGGIRGGGGCRLHAALSFGLRGFPIGIAFTCVFFIGTLDGPASYIQEYDNLRHLGGDARIRR